MKEILIVYGLLAESGVLIGSTADVLSIGLDKATIRRRRVIGDGQLADQQEPLIPGSTLKGKTRNQCERILASLGWVVCRAPRADTMCPHDAEVNRHYPLCPVCQLFGGPSQQSRLFFGDAVAKTKQHDTSLVDVDVESTRFLTRVQTGVAISRERRAAEDDRLYFVERGVEGVVYRGEVAGYLDEELLSRQLALLVGSLESLVAIGGGKSRGAGWTSFELITATIDEEPIPTEQWLKLRAEGLQAWRKS